MPDSNMQNIRQEQIEQTNPANQNNTAKRVSKMRNLVRVPSSQPQNAREIAQTTMQSHNTMRAIGKSVKKYKTKEGITKQPNHGLKMPQKRSQNEDKNGKSSAKRQMQDTAAQKLPTK